MASEPQIRVDEYHNGALFQQWDSITEAAKPHKVAYNLIKTLCATGTPLPIAEESITFDTPYDSIYSYEMRKLDNGKIVPELVIDRTKKGC